MLAKVNHSRWGRSLLSILENQLLQISLIFAFTVAVGMLTNLVITDPGSDLEISFLPSLYHWRTPWQDANLLFPWSVFVLMPLRFFSPVLAKAFVNMLSVVLTALVIRRFGGNMILTIPIFISPIGYWLLTTAQVDALILGGFLLLPAGFDLLFLWKPQVVLHALWPRVLRQPRVYIPAGMILLVLSYLIWGNWFQSIVGSTMPGLRDAWWNRSIWPYGIPVGLGLIFLSIKKRDETFGVMASPLLSPYVNGPSYIGLAAMIAAKWPGLFWTIYIAFWLYVLYKT